MSKLSKLSSEQSHSSLYPSLEQTDKKKAVRPEGLNISMRWTTEVKITHTVISESDTCPSPSCSHPAQQAESNKAAQGRPVRRATLRTILLPTSPTRSQPADTSLLKNQHIMQKWTSHCIYKQTGRTSWPLQGPEHLTQGQTAGECKPGLLTPS